MPQFSAGYCDASTGGYDIDSIKVPSEGQPETTDRPGWLFNQPDELPFRHLTEEGEHIALTGLPIYLEILQQRLAQLGNDSWAIE
jgi:hypothetical protein